MQGRAWYVVLAGWLLTVAGILGIAYGLFGLVVTLWAARVGYHTPGYSLVRNAISVGASLAIAAAALWGETLVDLAKPKQQHYVGDHSLSCGVCGAAMDSNLRSAIQSLARAWGSMKAMDSVPVHFHLRVDEERGTMGATHQSPQTRS